MAKGKLEPKLNGWDLECGGHSRGRLLVTSQAWGWRSLAEVEHASARGRGKKMCSGNVVEAS